MTTDEIKEQNPITTWVQDRGGKLRRSGGQLVTNFCPKVEHKTQHLCVSVSPEKGVWHCNDCEIGGTVIDWLMNEKGITLKDAIQQLGGDVNSTGTDNNTGVSTNGSPTFEPKGEPVKTYDYTDESGGLLFQVCRYEPKSFRQRQPKGEDWQWNLDGVTRVLYNLPKVLSSNIVCLTEGEKDADTLSSMGFAATTNAGGASSWLPAYAETLKGKEVYIFPDNDAAGEKRYRAILLSLEGKVKSAKKIVVPKEFKDVTDWLESLPENERAKPLCDLIEKTAHAIEPLPLYTIQEMEERYMDYVRELPRRAFSMNRLHPKFEQITKNLMPGELVMIMGDTGQGKTAVMQAIAKAANPIPTLFFQLELPLEAMFQRSVQMAAGCHEEDVLHDYKEGNFSMRERFKNLEHILTCDKSGLTMDNIEKLITMSELKFGKHPVLAMIDYMGLVRKEHSRSRYEAMAYSAEQAKVIAKRTNTIVFIGSQVGRPEKAEDGARVARKNIGLHDAKGAGELENSSNLVIGLTRPGPDMLVMKVLKNTRGPVGAELEFNFDGQCMQLTPL